MQSSRILVVEDEPIVALDLKHHLISLGYDVSATASSAEKAIACARDLRPDLILMDVKLKGAPDGIDAARAIATKQDTPIIFLTAFADGPTQERIKATSPYGYIVKPCDKRVLGTMIELAMSRHRVSRELEENRAWLLATLRSVGEGVIATDAAGTIKFINPVAETLTGWRAGSAIDRYRSDVLPYATDRENEQAATFRDKEGTVHNIELKVTVIAESLPASQGRGQVWVVRDVTEQQRRIDADHLVADISALLSRPLNGFIDLKDVLHHLVPRVADGAVIDIVDADGNFHTAAAVHRDEAVQVAMQRARRSSLYSRTGSACLSRAVLERKPVVLRRNPPLDDACVATALCLEDPIRAPDVCTVATVPLVVHRDDTIVGAITLLGNQERRYDQADTLAPIEQIAERLATAIDNSRLYETSQRAVSLREDVLRIVSHDLKNPLSAILMSSQRLGKSDRGLCPTDKKHIATVRRCADRMLRMVTDLLSVGKLEDGSLYLERAPCHPEELIREAVDMFHMDLQQRSLQIVIDPSLDDTEVFCDRERMMQVFSNIIGNALKFTEEGESIAVRAVRDGNAVRFSVSDGGRGVPADQIPHLFERYWQGGSLRKKGTGLGLYIAKSIVEATGGRIWAESTVDVGTTFFFTVPTAESPAAHMRAALDGEAFQPSAANLT